MHGRQLLALVMSAVVGWAVCGATIAIGRAVT